MNAAGDAKDPTDDGLRVRANAIVGAVLDAPTPQRDAIVEQQCGGDLVLRGLVQSLLAHGASLERFLVQSPGRERVESAETDLSGSRIGAWKVLRAIGRGGMGLVFEVERDDGVVRQRAALKLIKRGMDSDAIVARFRNERQILAVLDHPHIARLIDGGATTDGRPYLVMEYVEGLSLDLWCETRALGIEERLRLFIVVCNAVHYAHQRLVVHRDLKPANIVVGIDGTPKLLDFGIARLLDPAADSLASATAEAHRLFTPRYASPEQLAGGAISTASDVYALGVVLYEMLTGRAPYRVTTGSLVEMMRAVAEQEPLRPSAAVTEGRIVADGSSSVPRRDASDDPTAARGHGERSLPSERVERDARRLAQRLRGDLDHIVLKALAKEPARRYDSVAALRDDLSRHLAGEPIAAAPPSWRYRTGKFVRRHRAGVAGAALVLATLVAGTVMIAWHSRQIDHERLVAERRFADTRSLARAMLFDINDDLANGPTAAREKLVRTALTYLDRLSSERLEPDLQRDVASGYERIADIVGNPGLNNLGRPREAKAYLESARVLRERLASTDPDNPANLHGLVATYARLGELARFDGPPEEAARLLAIATTHAERLVFLAPDDADAATTLFVRRRGEALIRFAPGRPSLHRYQDAVDRYRQLMAEIDAFARDHPATDRLVEIQETILSELTDLLRLAGNAREALVVARRDLAVCEARAAALPDSPVWKRYVALAESKVGASLVDLGQDDEGLALLRSSLDRRMALLGADPANARAVRDVASGLSQVGNALETAGRPREALAAYLRWREKSQASVQRDPANRRTQLDLEQARWNVASAHLAIGETAPALVAARDVATTVVARDGPMPNEDMARESLGKARLIGARALHAQGSAAAAFVMARDGLPLLEANAKVTPEDAFAARDHARGQIETGIIGLAAEPALRAESCGLIADGRRQLQAQKANDRLAAAFQRFLESTGDASRRCGAGGPAN